MNIIDLDDMLRSHVRTMGRNRLLTQQQVADAVGIHRTALANWLSERRTLPLKHASRLITLIGPARIAQEIAEAAGGCGSKARDRLGQALQSHAELQELADTLARHNEPNVDETYVEEVMR